MEHSPEKYESIWHDSLKSTKDILGQDDFERVQTLQDPGREIKSLQQQCMQSDIARSLGSLGLCLARLRTWAEYLLGAINSKQISPGCVWGVISLLVQLGSRSDASLREVTRYFGELRDQIELFEVYTKSVELDPESLERFFRLLVDLVLAGARAIRHFRRNTTTGAMSSASWKHVDEQFSDLIKSFTARVKHLQQLVEARRLTEMSLNQSQVLQSLSRLNLPEGEAANLPYYQLPFGRNSAFYGRTGILHDIRNAFQEQADAGQLVSSVALWGTGGIGKSQVALEYASVQVQEQCQLVLWIPAQSGADISRALVRAANQVHPPGYEESMSADRARFIMWNWLQTTKTRWCIVFDNVDDNDLLTSNWPVTGNGQILVTCRSELVAACPAASAIEIPCFTAKDGGQLLLNLAGKKKVSEAEAAAAEELSELLGGLALAIAIVGHQILVKKKSMVQFLPYFQRHKQSLRKWPRHFGNPYYSNSLETVWQTSFDSLDEKSSHLLGLICFFAPDDIPRTLFDTAASILNTDEYEEAEELLLRLALIKINEHTQMISVHRLVQDAYHCFLPEKKRHEVFGVAYRILCEAFPKRTLRRQMYPVWRQCELLIHHIEALQDRYEELKSTGLDVQDLAFHTMLADVTWFCGETCALQLGEKLGKRAAENCADKNSLIYGYLCESVATIDHRRGRYEDAYAFFRRSLSIREKDSITTDQELADAYSAIGLALFGLFASEEAIEWVDKALAVAYAAPAELQGTFNIDRYLRNRSRPKAALRDFEGAKQDVADAEAFQTKEYGPNSHFHGETAYILGKIAIQEGDLDLAMRHLQRAYDLQYPGKPTHQSVASALYHQARVCLGRGHDRKLNDERALEYLQQALTITQFNEPRRGDQGESARVKWQISKIWERQGKVEDAATYRAAALRVKTELERTGLYPQAPDEEQAWDCFSDLVDR